MIDVKTAMRNGRALLAAYKNLEFLKFKLPPAAADTVNIIGNGPSFAETLEDPVQSVNLKQGSNFCCNGFANSELFSVVRPRYYALFDPDYWLENVSAARLEQREGIYRNILDKTQWKMYIFFPMNAQRSKALECLQGKSHLEVVFVNNTVIDAAPGILYTLFKRNLAMPHIQNVLVAMLFIAINIGYKRVIVHGADHNWTEFLDLNDENVVCFKDKHFYDTGEPKLTPLMKDKDNSFKMDEILFAFAKTFLGYREIQEYARWREVHVYNASKKTFIDAFERM